MAVVLEPGVDSQRTKVYSEMVEITPVQAQRWLLDSQWPGQRAFGKAQAASLAAMMQREHWKPTPGIDFGILHDQWYSLNGQHRLNAIVSSGCTVRMLVTWQHFESYEDLVQAYVRFDRNVKARSLVDTYVALGLPEKYQLGKDQVQRTAAGLTIIANGFRPRNPPPVLRADDVRVELMEGWAEAARVYFSAIAGCPTERRQRLEISGVIAVGLVTCRYQAERASRFWHDVAYQESLRSGDPPYLAGTYLQRREIGGRIKLRATGHEPWIVARYLAAVWNAAFEHRQLMQFAVRDTSSPIRINGTPYDGRAVILPFEQSES